MPNTKITSKVIPIGLFIRDAPIKQVQAVSIALVITITIQKYIKFIFPKPALAHITSSGNIGISKNIGNKYLLFLISLHT